MNEEIRNDVIEDVTEEVEVMEKKKTVFDKAKELGNKGMDKLKATGKWIKENPGKAAEAGMYIVGGVCITALTAAGFKNANDAKKDVYSKDIGESVRLKKELSNSDKVELDFRMSNGQSKIQALNEMDLLKR